MTRLDIRFEYVQVSTPVSLPEPLGIGRHITVRMFTRNFTAGRGWHDATIGPCRPLALDPAVIAHCGQMVFDGTKAYARTDGHPNLFRPDKSVEVAAANPSWVVGT